MRQPLDKILKEDTKNRFKQDIDKLLHGNSTPAANLSGKDWWNKNQEKYPNSTKLTDLELSFRTKVEAFLKALDEAKATVMIETTKRPHIRAHLMHYSWKLSKGEIPNSSNNLE